MSRKRSIEMFPIVESYLSSSDHVDELCERHGLTKGQFYYWYRKYQEENEAVGNSGSFVPVEIIGDSREDMIEVETPGGVILRSRSLIPVSYIRALVEQGC